MKSVTDKDGFSQDEGSLGDQQWFLSAGHVQGVDSGRDTMSDNEYGPDVEAETEAATQEFEPYDPDVKEEEDAPLRPIVICELELRAEELKTRVVSTGARKIQFYGDHTGASVPTNLLYSSVKTTWTGK
uniref:Uncharacterized protein n=1 Tax=Solanum tuberosum TaxID=4113 RepID=M0ZNR6_SOLTU